MLEILRAKSRSVVIYVLFGIIIVVFVISFGPGSKGCSLGQHTETWAAKVNGMEITPGAFQAQYQAVRAEHGPSSAFARQQALERAIRIALIEEEAHRHGILVSDEELSNAIVAMREFKGPDGQFDPDRYRRAVVGSSGSQGRFEEETRRGLVLRKMIELVSSTAKMSDEEVKEAWEDEHERVNLEFATFSFAQGRSELKGPSDAQVADFAAKNGPRIEQYYKENLARFDKPRRVRARHILVKVPANAGEAEEAAAKKKILALAERIKKGEDFARVAAESSDDLGSKEQGGELGFFGRGLMAKPFEDQAFRLKPGEMSEPVRTQFGWHLIKVEAIAEPEVVPLEKARPEIARELIESNEARKLAGQKAQAALRLLKNGRSFSDIFPQGDQKGQETTRGAGWETLGGRPVVREETGAFTAGHSPNVPKIGLAPDLFADAMKASAGDLLPKVYEGPSGFVLARAKEREHPDEKAWQADKQTAEASLRSSQQMSFVRSWIEGLRQQAKVTMNPAFATSEMPAAPEPE